VIEAAAQLFTERGYRGTGVEDIAATVGLAKPTSNHYFNSNLDVLWAIFHEILDTMRIRRAKVDHLPPHERIKKQVITLVVFQAENPVLASAFFELANWLPPARRAVVKRSYQPVTESLKSA
jgi:AcrR family transcriptional regulator